MVRNPLLFYYTLFIKKQQQILRFSMPHISVLQKIGKNFSLYKRADMLLSIQQRHINRAHTLPPQPKNLPIEIAVGPTLFQNSYCTMFSYLGVHLDFSQRK